MRDSIYQHVLFVTHIPTYGGDKIAVAVLPAIQWWEKKIVESSRFLVTPIDVVVATWTLYNTGDVEDKTTIAIFRSIIDAESFYESKVTSIIEQQEIIFESHRFEDVPIKDEENVE